MSFDGQTIATGSAFFYLYKGRTFLVTNRHNLTGRNQDTGEVLSKKTGGIPNQLSFRYPHYIQDREGYGISLNTEHIFVFGWDLDESYPWLEHPKFGADTDIAVLDCLKEWSYFQRPILHVNEDPNQRNIDIWPGSPVKVLGYPFGLQVGDYYPVWLSGSIASEPNFQVNNRNAIYIDCRTNRGASGSPVFSYYNGGGVPLEDRQSLRGSSSFTTHPDGTYSARFLSSVHKFIGIYSGRINAQSDIGYVWKEELIQEICEQAI